MINIDEAKRIALKNKIKRVLLSVTELTDSWVFVFAYEDGTPAFDGPIRVDKESGEAYEWNYLKRSEIAEYEEKLIKTEYLINPKSMV